MAKKVKQNQKTTKEAADTTANVEETIADQDEQGEQTEQGEQAEQGEQTEQEEPSECSKEQGELEKLVAERDEFKSALVRERADFENYKKRNALLAATSFQNGVSNTATAILPVLDNFERALSTDCEDKGFYDGMTMIMRQLQDMLKSLGIEEIAIDGMFDPNLHNAVMQVEEEGFESNQIVETLQKGYIMKDTVIRHAMVKVNK